MTQELKKKCYKYFNLNRSGVEYYKNNSTKNRKLSYAFCINILILCIGDEANIKTNYNSYFQGISGVDKITSGITININENLKLEHINFFHFQKISSDEKIQTLLENLHSTISKETAFKLLELINTLRTVYIFYININKIITDINEIFTKNNETYTIFNFSIENIFNKTIKHENLIVALIHDINYYEGFHRISKKYHYILDTVNVWILEKDNIIREEINEIYNEFYNFFMQANDEKFLDEILKNKKLADDILNQKISYINIALKTTISLISTYLIYKFLLKDKQK